MVLCSVCHVNVILNLVFVFLAQTMLSSSGWQNCYILLYSIAEARLTVWCIFMHCIFLLKFIFQRGSLSEWLTPSHSNLWMSKRSSTTHVLPGEGSSLSRTTTTKVGLYRSCLDFAYCMPIAIQAATSSVDIMRLRLVIGAYPWECCGGMFPLVYWCRRVVLAIAYWLRAETACHVPSLQARYWYCGAFCKCDSHGGRVLSDFLS